MVKKIISSSLLAVFLIFISCQNQGAVEDPKVPVETERVSLGQVEQALVFNGDIKAEFEVNVFSKVPDRIEKYFVEAGDRVTPNSPIAKVTATPYEQAVHQAEAGLAAADAQALNLKTEFQRAERLRREDAMSQQQYDAVKTQYEAVMAQVKQASAALVSARSASDDATVTAPISGIIGKRYLEAGDMAAPGMPVASVVQMNRVKIEAEATEADLGRLTLGQDAELVVRAYPDEVFKGRVSRISPVLDPLTRMATFEVLVPNRDHRLKPGMFAELKVITGIIQNVMVVPRHCVIENTSLETVNGRDKVRRNYYVYIVNDSLKAEQRKLDVGYVNHRVLAVNSGIELGEQLVIQGQKNLREGSVVILPEAEEAE